MNIGEIAEKFIRAAEVERASHEHVGPAALRAQQRRMSIRSPTRPDGERRSATSS
jgi:hypothetical protein